ncbi:TonB-dependent receptor [bacterium]|nr:TonB-dependent receptor [bacterium]
MRRSAGVFLFTAVLFASFPLSGQEHRVRPDSVHIDYYFDPVIVTATKLKNSQRDLAASTSVISRYSLEEAASGSALDIVQEQVPSLYLSQWGVMGYGAAGKAAGKLSLRGMGGGADTHVLILRNGRPDFMGLMGCTIADDFTSAGIGRIEVIRGPGSFLYGTNATGGVINLLPKTMSRRGFSTTLSAGGGSYRSRTFDVEHGGRTGTFDYYLTAGRRATGGSRPESDFSGDQMTLHTGYRPGKGPVLEFNANLSDTRLTDPGVITAPLKDNWYEMTRWGGDLNLTNAGRFGATTLKLYANFGAHRFFDGWRSRDALHGIMIYHSYRPLPGNETTVGFDYKRYGGTAHDASADYGTIFLSEYAPYLHTQQLLFGRFILSGGLRAEHHELYGWETLPKLGLTWHPGGPASLRLSASKGFRSPSIRELYFWMPANDQLTPDRVWNYELGVSTRFRSWLKLEGVVFRNRGSNLIQFSGPPPQWVNSGSYDHLGLEVMLYLKPCPSLEAGATWSELGHDESRFNVPGRQISAWARYVTGPLTVRTNLRAVHGLTGAEFTAGPVPLLHAMPDYAVIDLSLFFRVFSHTELRVHLRNLLDEQYQSMWGYPMPGRHLMADAAYHF